MPGTFGVTKGTLSGDGPSYTLPISSPVDGTLTVVVEKTGYDITGSVKTVNIIGSATQLVAGQWANGELSEGSSVDWYKITVSSSTTYRIWWNDKDQGNGTKTLDVMVSAWYANGTTIFGTSFGVDSGWNTAQSFTPSANNTVYVKVVPYSTGAEGSYGVVFTANNATRPAQ
jgi:hypothetical protein